MTVAAAGRHDGLLHQVVATSDLDTDKPVIETVSVEGRINPDLTVGVDVTGTVKLLGNASISHDGVKLHGGGFIVRRGEAEHLGLGRRAGLDAFVRPYRNGRDLAQHSRDLWVIDLFGLASETVQERFPEIYQHVASTVRPERENNRRQTYRDNWWLFGEPRKEMRPAVEGLNRYIATVDTARHRVFQFVNSDVIVDDKVVVIASDGPEHLAILSSLVHVDWSLRAGAWLGVGNDPVYVKSRCFDPFPFPAWTEGQGAALAELGERLDAARKQRLAEHSELTSTRLYNALEAHRAGRPMSDQEKADFGTGSVLILDELHREIDRLTLEAYDWPADETAEQRLVRLVALNTERAAEEARGEVRWLRPDYQKARFAPAEVAGPSQSRDLIGEVPEAVGAKPTFPTDRTGQHLAVLSRLQAASAPYTAAEIAAGFKGTKVASRVESALRALARLGYAQPTPDGRAFTARRAA